MERQNPVFRSLKLIEERISEKLTVEVLAREMHLSRFHYQRVFRDAVGDSVMKYVARRRLSLAAQALAETDATVLEIALQYGYDTHEGFTRSFKALMGVTPMEYRRYSRSAASPKLQKERESMLYGKNTDEIIRELNGLIVQAKETAACLRKGQGIEPQAWALYAPLWEAAANRTDAMAGRLAQTLWRITEAMQRPDGISARFMLIKAIEDAAFQSSVSAFQAGLMIARAKPEHRAALQPVCERYALLARNARIKAERIAGFLQELAISIFQDMKTQAKQLMEETAQAGFEAARPLKARPDLPYGYITLEILAIADELSHTPFSS
ncbi:MAG: helix-turn-helix transcriptional regulator [Provencibacterium sp.]|jgi:AraC-like DNA-binding protein|nr:helix-turn-helix transcriptional regulator [Provencibacterium sp.]